MEKELNVNQPYIRHNGVTLIYQGGPNFIKDAKPCPSCGHTISKLPINTEFLTWGEGYLIIHVTDRGIMFVDNNPPEFYWRCDTCPQGYGKVE